MVPNPRYRPRIGANSHQRLREDPGQQAYRLGPGIRRDLWPDFADGVRNRPLL